MQTGVQVWPPSKAYCVDRDCDWQSYQYRHTELYDNTTYRNNAWQLRKHYVERGRAEGKTCVIDPQRIAARSVQIREDWSRSVRTPPPGLRAGSWVADEPE